MDKLKYIKLENEDGSYSDSIPLAVDSDHVDVGGNTLTNTLNNKANSVDVNNSINNLSNEINRLASGSPLVASSISEMTDTTRIYVNTTDGHWYWYDGDSWEDGGVYQATGIGEESIYKYMINKSLVGNKFLYSGASNVQTPVISFRLLNNFDMGDLQSLRLKAKFANLNDTKLGNGYFEIFFHSSGFGQGFNFIQKFPGDVDPNDSVILDMEKNFTSQWGGVKPQFIAFRLNMATLRIYHYTIEDLEFYINGNKLEYGKDYTFRTDVSTQTDITEDFDYLATKNYINEKIDDINTDIDNINDEITSLENIIDDINTDIDNINDEITSLENSIPSQEQLEILTNYDTATKSNLYKVSCWGDSLTAGDYPTFLQLLLGNNVVVTNNGASGQCSGEIAFRQGGVQLYTAKQITIPANNTDSVTFTCTASNGYTSSLSRFDENVTIYGINGRLQLTNNGFVFTRSDSGEETIVPQNTEITKSSQTQYLDNVSIIWVGRNDVAFNSNALASLLPTVEGMINVLNTEIKRYLIISPTTATDEYEGGQYETQYNLVKSMEQALQTNYPRNYVDIEYYLVNQCIYDMGITPTAEDLLNMQRGTIPPSLMADTIHPKNSTREYIAKYIYNEMLKRDWVR